MRGPYSSSSPRGARPADGRDLRGRGGRGDQLVVGMGLDRGPAAAGGGRRGERARAGGRRAHRAVPGPHGLDARAGRRPPEDARDLRVLRLRAAGSPGGRLEGADVDGVRRALLRPDRAARVRGGRRLRGALHVRHPRLRGLDVRPDLRRGAGAPPAVRAVGRPGLRRLPRQRRHAREAAPERRHLRLDVARRPLGPRRSRHDHELQRVERGHPDRARVDALRAEAMRPTPAPTACATATPRTPISRALPTGRASRQRPSRRG